ncbi:DUF3304 domain-containing protein [Pseudomonas putida]|uniref:DUF3304 domain-containing protein n=1 Tax=Pseudomonas putida TaxID=303 RepID=A0A1Q9R5E5_PSEPU|nr:DUF3304 domain-containing protein [Pseudomonas putida]OLS62626.1 hypothetical protein PSEMO_23880 [Pseudomonas putida]
MKPFISTRRLSVCGLTALLSIPAAQAGILKGVNHTHWAINRFSVDGRSGLDIIGPWQRGGGGHYSVPGSWQPGMAVRVDWETGVAYTDDFPGFEDWSKYAEWKKRVNAQKRKNSRIVPVPKYTTNSACGLTVHFLPCDEIQVTTSCYGYGHPDYPIKTPLRLPEPQSCPASSASIPAQGVQQ